MVRTLLAVDCFAAVARALSTPLFRRRGALSRHKAPYTTPPPVTLWLIEYAGENAISIIPFLIALSET